MTNVSKYVGIFLRVLALVLGVPAVAPAVFGGGAPPGVQPENASTFAPNAILADEFNESAVNTTLPFSVPATDHSPGVTKSGSAAVDRVADVTGP